MKTPQKAHLSSYHGITCIPTASILNQYQSSLNFERKCRDGTEVETLFFRDLPAEKAMESYFYTI